MNGSKPIGVYERRGLSECLEDYAARVGLRRETARPLWRIGALFALNVKPVDADVFAGVCRVAPGVAVPVPDLTPADVLEADHEFTTITWPGVGVFERVRGGVGDGL